VVEKKGKGEEDSENPPTPGDPNYLAAERTLGFGLAQGLDLRPSPVGAIWHCIIGGSASDYKVSNAQGFKVWRKLKMVRKVHAGHQDGKRI
jgi:hypothetical protein